MADRITEKFQYNITDTDGTIKGQNLLDINRTLDAYDLAKIMEELAKFEFSSRFCTKIVFELYGDVLNGLKFTATIIDQNIIITSNNIRDMFHIGMDGEIVGKREGFDVVTKESPSEEQPPSEEESAHKKKFDTLMGLTTKELESIKIDTMKELSKIQQHKMVLVGNIISLQHQITKEGEI